MQPLLKNSVMVWLWGGLTLSGCFQEALACAAAPEKYTPPIKVCLHVSTWASWERRAFTHAVKPSEIMPGRRYNRQHYIHESCFKSSSSSRDNKHAAFSAFLHVFRGLVQRPVIRRGLRDDNTDFSSFASCLMWPVNISPDMKNVPPLCGSRSHYGIALLMVLRRQTLYLRQVSAPIFYESK